MPTTNDRSATQDSLDALGFLEPGQLADTRRTPVPRAELGGRAQAALWSLRIIVLLLVVMVGYTFVTQLGS
jgi:hypothetical protein